MTDEGEVKIELSIAGTWAGVFRDGSWQTLTVEKALGIIDDRLLAKRKTSKHKEPVNEKSRLG